MNIINRCTSNTVPGSTSINLQKILLTLKTEENSHHKKHCIKWIQYTVYILQYICIYTMLFLIEDNMRKIEPYLRILCSYFCCSENSTLHPCSQKSKGFCEKIWVSGSKVLNMAFITLWISTLLWQYNTFDYYYIFKI